MTRLGALLRGPLGLLLALQLGWWAAVGGAAAGLPFLGPWVVGALLVLQVRALPPSEVRPSLVVLAALTVVGTVLDSAQAATGLLAFAGAPVDWLAPLWIVALWAHFGTAVDSVSRLCRERWWALAVCGAVGGPLSYLGGARMGAATLHPEVWPAVFALALEWALVLPLASWLFRWSSTSERRPVELSAG